MVRVDLLIIFLQKGLKTLPPNLKGKIFNRRIIMSPKHIYVILIIFFRSVLGSENNLLHYN